MLVLESAVAFVLILGVLVVVHEWGHFIVARLCGIRVDEFSIGFGPRAIRIGQRGDTEYNIRWIPLGGYVKIAGMEPDEEPLIRAAEKVKELGGRGNAEESAVDSGKALTEIPLIAENTPNLAETADQKKRDEIDGFYAHPLWQRALVIFAGPLMSFVLGYAIFFGLFWLVGFSDISRTIGAILPGSEAQHVGLAAGDIVTSINGAKITDGVQMVDIIQGSLGKPLRIVVQRSGKLATMTAVPRKMPGQDQPIGALGFNIVPDTERLTAPEAFSAANRVTVLWLHAVGGLLRRHNFQEIRQSAGGPIFIAQKTKQAVAQGGEDTFSLMAQLSMSLAIFNLLPIPILDGGHLLIFFIEAVRRGRRLTMEQQQNFMLTGLAVIGVLFLLIMCNDIMRNIPHVH